MTNAYQEIMTIGETAEYLRISMSSLYKLAQDGRIPCQKVGRHWRFRKQTIDHWLDAAQRLEATTHAQTQLPAEQKQE